MSTSTAPATNVFELLGIKPVINARGNNTVLGGDGPAPRVLRLTLDPARARHNAAGLVKGLARWHPGDCRRPPR